MVFGPIKEPNFDPMVAEQEELIDMVEERVRGRIKSKARNENIDLTGQVFKLYIRKLKASELDIPVIVVNQYGSEWIMICEIDNYTKNFVYVNMPLIPVGLITSVDRVNQLKRVSVERMIVFEAEDIVE
jgi:hypothetical protein